MKRNPHKIVWFTVNLFFTSLDGIQRVVDAGVTQYTVQVRWVPEIEETKNFAPQSQLRIGSADAAVVYVCEDHKNRTLIEWCREAMNVFTATYPYGRVNFQPNAQMERVRWYQITETVDERTQKDFVQACKCPLDWQIYLTNDLESGDKVIAIIKRPKHLRLAEPEPSTDNDIEIVEKPAGPSSPSPSTCIRRHCCERKINNDNRSTSPTPAPPATRPRDEQRGSCAEGCDCFLGCLGEACCRPAPRSYRNAPRTQADVDAAFWNGWMMNDICELFVRCLGIACEHIGPICEHVGNNMETYGGCIGEICGVCCEDCGCCVEFIGHLLDPRH